MSATQNTGHSMVPATLRELRQERGTVASDAVSGMITAVINVPGDLANGLLAGTSPVYGLYSLIGGTGVAALFTSSYIMAVDATSASALATAEVLRGVPPEQHLASLVVLCLLVGLFQILFGLLGLGSLTSFISNAVMTGFLTGIALLTILGQVGDLTGYASAASNKVGRLVDTLLHPGQIHLPTLGVGIATIAMIVAVGRTPWARYSYPLALLATTAAVPLLGLDSVALVGDTTQMPTSLINLNVPDLTLIPVLIGPALAIAAITLVQASGVSQSIPNPDGAYPDPSIDFRGQGIANLAVGALGGLPVGGSLSNTTLVQACGGRSRWANIFTSVFAALAVLLLAGLIERLPMPTLAGMLVMVGIEMLNPGRILLTLKTGRSPAAMLLLTLLATLFLPIQTAVAIGVMLHFAVHIYQSVSRTRIVQARIVDGDQIELAPAAPASLRSDDVILLVPIGSLFFAAAARFEAMLPQVGDARRTVVIISLSEHDELGSTFIRVLGRYAKALHANEGLLMLVGVSDRVHDQLSATGLLRQIGPEHVLGKQPRLGGSMLAGARQAEQWLAARRGSPQPPVAAAVGSPGV